MTTNIETLVKELEDEFKISQRDLKDIKSNIRVGVEPDSTYVLIFAVHKSPSYNSAMAIPCDRGTPIGGYLFDPIHNCFQVFCVDYLPLGYINISFTLNADGVGEWSTTIPVPEVVLKRHMSEDQKKDLRKFKNGFKPSSDYTFEFLQLIG